MDLMFAVILIFLLCLWTLLVGLRIGACPSRLLRLWVPLTVLGLSGIYSVCLWNRPVLTRCLPHTALIILANLHPLMGSFFAGMYLSTSSIRLWRRCLVGPSTLMLAAYSIVAPVLGAAPACAPANTEETLISQSTPFTCSAAAAATLLRLHGIKASEEKMAQLCLTRHGTHWLGVYRGLLMMTQNSDWKVVAKPYSPEMVLHLGDQPAILCLYVAADSRRRGGDLAFSKSAGHSVVALQSDPRSGVAVFDPAPSYDIESWGRAILNQVTDGVILRLVARGTSQHADSVTLRVRKAVLARYPALHLEYL